MFQSGFTANAGAVSSILGKDDFIVSDELNHASIIDGARLSRATIKVFPHRDVAAARTIVAGLRRDTRDDRRYEGPLGRYEGPLARLTQLPLCDSPLRG